MNNKKKESCRNLYRRFTLIMHHHSWFADLLDLINEGETTAIATDGDVLFTILVEDACASSSSFDWILDSGASHHVTPCKDSFVSYNPGDYGRVHLGNNHFCSIVGVGDVQIKMKNGQDILLKQVRHVP